MDAWAYPSGLRELARTFADLTFGGLSAMEAAWGRAIAYGRGGQEALHEIFGPGDLHALLSASSLRSPSIRVVKDGKDLAPSSYLRQFRIGQERRDDMLDTERALALLNEGASIAVQSAQSHSSKLRQLRAAIQGEFGHPVNINIYITPGGGNQGLVKHSDPHDVVVLQVLGRKYWDTWETVSEEGVGTARVLEPGDLLYLPAGTPHNVRSLDCLSAHLTIGITAITYRDVFQALSGSILAADRRLPIGFASQPGLTRATLSRVLSWGAESLPKNPNYTDAGVATLSGSFAPGFPEDASTIVALAALDSDLEGGEFRLRPEVWLRARSEQGSIIIDVGRRQIRFPGNVFPALTELLEGKWLRCGSAPGLSEADSLDLSKRLAREGLIQFR